MFGLLGRVLLGAFVAVAATALVAAIVIRIRGIITRESCGKVLTENGISKAVIDSIDRCENKVSLNDLLNNSRPIEITGDGIDYSLHTGDIVNAE